MNNTSAADARIQAVSPESICPMTPPLSARRSLPRSIPAFIRQPTDRSGTSAFRSGYGSPRGLDAVRTAAPARMLLLGRAPFDEPLFMWWNFVGHSVEEFVEAREDWVARRRFGEVLGFDGPRLDASSMIPDRLKPRVPLPSPVPAPVDGRVNAVLGRSPPPTVRTRCRGSMTTRATSSASRCRSFPGGSSPMKAGDRWSGSSSRFATTCSRTIASRSSAISPSSTEPRPRASHGWRPTSRRPRPARRSRSSS